MTTATETPAVTAPAKTVRRKKFSQLRFMLMLSLVFFTGIALYVIIPESAFRDVFIGLFSVAVCYVIMKFGF